MRKNNWWKILVGVIVVSILWDVNTYWQYKSNQKLIFNYVDWKTAVLSMRITQKEAMLEDMKSLYPCDITKYTDDFRPSLANREDKIAIEQVVGPHEYSPILAKSPFLNKYLKGVRDDENYLEVIEKHQQFLYECSGGQSCWSDFNRLFTSNDNYLHFGIALPDAPYDRIQLVVNGIYQNYKEGEAVVIPLADSIVVDVLYLEFNHEIDSTYTSFREKL